MFKENASYRYEIKNSKFIALLFQLNNSNEIEKIFEFLKKEHKKSRHICYAFKIFENDSMKIKAFDDGEPKGTASIPILNAIEKNNINNVVVFVIRYFGGIKLGKGGLYRAYTKASLEVIKEFIQN